MYRQVARYSYWAGLACVVIDVVWRALVVVWPAIPGSIYGLWRVSFRNAAFVFLILSLASVGYAWLMQQTMPAATDKKTAG